MSYAKKLDIDLGYENSVNFELKCSQIKSVFDIQRKKFE
jgi:hypothetical protein